MRFADPRIQGTFDGMCERWWDVRYVDTKLPIERVARVVGQMGRALAGEQVAAEQWRNRNAFAPVLESSRHTM